MIGIRNIYSVAADIVINNNAALAAVAGMASPIAKNQKQKIKLFLPFSVGATGGIKYQFVVPAGGALFITATKIINTVAPAIVTSLEAASAAVGNAVANAGSHWLEVEGYVVNGNTAGSIILQAAQNTADLLDLTLLAGGTLEVTIL